jgi:uncharacterized protein
VKLALIVLAISCALVAQVVKRDSQFPGIQEELGVTIPMRDEIRLAADVFRPAGNGHFPALLVRTPYNRKSSAMTSYRAFSRQGYAVVIEDVRGRFASQGVTGSIAREGPDGNDTINWVADQPWSNGQVAMVGASYLGIVQWWAAIQDNPHLVTIAPVNSGDDEYLDRFYSPGGALKLGHRLLWLAQNFTPPAQVRPPFRTYISHLPIRTSDVAATGTVVPWWRSALAHPSYDAYWKALSIRQNLPRVRIPVLSMSGWFDNYAESELDAFTRLSRSGDTVETWIGPWSHVPALKFATRNFGPEAQLHVRAVQAEWFDRWMKGREPLERPRPESVLHVFVMGPDIWREEHEWPLARTRFTPLYLVSDGHANSVNGDGALTWQRPEIRHRWVHLRPAESSANHGRSDMLRSEGAAARAA